MSSRKNISILVGIIGVLILLLAASVGYIVANNESFSGTSIVAKNDKILKEINDLKTIYDAKIADKTNSYMVYQLQKDSIHKLLSQLENSKNSEESLLKYKTEYKNLESKMKILVQEIYELKSKKNKVEQKKEIIVEETNFKKRKLNSSKNNFSIKKTEINKEAFVNTKQEAMVETSSKSIDEIAVTKTKKNGKLSISNIKAQAYASKSSSKKVETNSASNADFIKISFTLNENPDVESGEKTFYFQVIGSNNNVMGKRITEYFDTEALTYSFSKTINYINQSVEISQDFLNANFPKGYYFINIFERDQVVGKTSLLLK